jgi:hypothetical protein
VLPTSFGATEAPGRFVENSLCWQEPGLPEWDSVATAAAGVPQEAWREKRYRVNAPADGCWRPRVEVLIEVSIVARLLSRQRRAWFPSRSSDPRGSVPDESRDSAP